MKMKNVDRIRAVEMAVAAVCRHIADNDGKYSEGRILGGQVDGYRKGYRDALMDTLALFRSGYLPKRDDYWEEFLRDWMQR